jgi:phosphoserine aminotransferase
VPEFIDRAPAELIDEAFAFIIANGGLPEGVAKNSQSHTTLPAQVDGATTDTSAGTAAEGD